MITQLVILAALLLVVPLLAGGVFVEARRSCDKLLFRWVSGQMLLWAGFELICVPLTLLEKSFTSVVRIFWLYTACVILLAVLLDIVRRRKGHGELKAVPCAGSERDALSIALWCLAAGLLLMQLVLACVLAYEEGDDAFYVSISTVTADSDTMYLKLPYTGRSTVFDIRHGLAPFPIWISYLARVSGMPAVTVAQIVLPVVLIVMSYGIYFIIGRHLFQEHSRKLPLFMLLLECLVLFGGYSLYTAENFLLVRTAQGKAVIAGIIIPFLFLLFLMLLEKVQNGKKAGGIYWLLVACVMVAGDLCSTQGIQLTGMLLGILGGCTAAAYRRWKLLLPMAGCCVVPGVLMLLYLWLNMMAPA